MQLYEQNYEATRLAKKLLLPLAQKTVYLKGREGSALQHA